MSNPPTITVDQIIALRDEMNQNALLWSQEAGKGRYNNIRALERSETWQLAAQMITTLIAINHQRG